MSDDGWFFCFLLIIFTVGGCVGGCYTAQNGINEELIKRGYKEYNAKSGQLIWTEDKKKENKQQ